MNYNNVYFETSSGTDKSLCISDLPEICFSGKSNVGKSSLINKVLGRKSIARVSTRPGKTVTVNFFGIDGKVRIADLPGYGYAKVSNSEKLRWSKLMESYFSSGRNIKTVFQLIDIRHAPSTEDLEMIDYLIQSGYKFVVLLTKSDKLNKSEFSLHSTKIVDELGLDGSVQIIPTSAETGLGIDDIRKIIEECSQ